MTATGSMLQWMLAANQSPQGVPLAVMAAIALWVAIVHFVLNTVLVAATAAVQAAGVAALERPDRQFRAHAGGQRRVRLHLGHPGARVFVPTRSRSS
jgi:hypothetical protein